MNQHFDYRGCYLDQSGEILTAGNDRIRRSWKITDSGLLPQTLENPVTGETLTKPGDGTDFIGPVEATGCGAVQSIRLDGCEDDDFGFAEKHLEGNLTLTYSQFSVRYEFAIYPDLPVLRMRMFLRGSAPIPLKEFPALDELELTEKHCEWEAVSLRAVTDSHNSLVRRWNGMFYLTEMAKPTGNILRVHRTLQNDGLILVKESPALEEQVRYAGWDFTIFSRGIAVQASGFEPSDVKADEWVPLYGTALCLYSGGELEFLHTLRTYEEARHKFRPGFDGAVSSNTWGDDHGGTKIREDFLQSDIQAAHEAGVTHYQIDAGWSTSKTDPKTGRSLWQIKYDNLPYGLERVAETTKRLGMKLGLWFVPYTENDSQYAFYREDAQSIIDLYRNTGACFFKLDGFKLESYTATYRFEKMMQIVLKDTDSNVFFNIDVTNWPRTGFLGSTQYGSIFAENRYSDHLSYYPHYTLRNLWTVSRCFPAYRFQAEVLNLSRNAGLYDEDEKDDPLAPSRCDQNYVFASVLFASPLVWMEPSMLDSSVRKQLGGLADSVKELREEAVPSFVLPIGEEPNGVHITGFQAMRDPDSGWLLILREAGERSEAHFELYGGVGSGYRFTEILSNCESGVRPGADSGVFVALGRKYGYAVYRYEKE